jgi:hypothetical protein
MNPRFPPPTVDVSKLKFSEAPDKQPGTNQQDKSERKFGCNKRPM